MKVARQIYRHSYIPVIFILFLPLVCFGQDETKSSSKEQQPNGISAGRPKIFDSRALTLMLETLNDQLRNVKVIDQKTLAAALGLQQGFSSTEFTSNLNVSTLPVPASKQETVSKTGNVSSTGASLPDTTQKTTTASREAVNAQIPTLEASPTNLPAGYTPSYGQSAGDLLSDQVNLQYQIFNLQMLLERSLSDRLLMGPSVKPRLQAVLGVNITLDPPRTANDAVAVVEITVEATGPNLTPDGLSLVAMMPQEKTYNAAAVSTKSHSFGGAAVVKMVQAGYEQRKKSQVFYLYRDMDTIAYERTEAIQGNKNKVVFGWMFRPVLGRRSISPGLRQMFAILALPAEDCAPQPVQEEEEEEENEQEGQQTVSAQDACTSQSQMLKTNVKTYWKKYDRDTITSYKKVDANRARRISFVATLGLNKPEIFQHRYENHAEYKGIEVRSTSLYEESLRAKVDQVSWRLSGAKTVVISVHGQNFFTDTKVSLGDKIYATPADGFYLKSAQSFDLTTTLDALAAGRGTVLSRYGRAVPLRVKLPKDLRGIRFDLNKIDIPPPVSGYRTITVDLRVRGLAQPLQPFDDLSKSIFRSLSPLVSLNNNVVPPPYEMSVPHPVPTPTPSPAPSSEETSANKYSTIQLEVNVPDSYFVNGGGILKVSWPFLPDKWTRNWVMGDAGFEVIRLSSKAIVIRRFEVLGFTLDPESLKKANPPYCWKILAGDEPADLYTDVCPASDKGPLGSSDYIVSFKVNDDKTIPEKIFLIDPQGGTYKLDVPSDKAKDTSTVKPIVLKQYDALWIEVTGEDLTGAVSAEANGIVLKVRVPKPASDAPATTDSKPVRIKTIEVEITREVTAKPGDIDLTILDKDGKPVDKVRRRLQITCVLCGEGGK